jgi:hypothetical protein
VRIEPPRQLRDRSIHVPQLRFQKLRQVSLKDGEIQISFMPCAVRSTQTLDVSPTVFPDAFRYNFSHRQQSSKSGAKQIVTGGARGTAVSFNERMDPVQSPEPIGRNFGGGPIEPVLMDGRYEPIHQLRHFLEVRRKMIAHIYRLFAEAAAELRNIRHGNVVQSPTVYLSNAVWSCLRPISIQLVSRPYCRERFFSCTSL